MPDLLSTDKIFVPRTRQPGPQEKYWIQQSYGGYSVCISPDTSSQYGYGPGSTLPNCVGWAWGRFYEILGKYPSLCTGNAGLWYSYTADGYKRGVTPQLGAVACWSKPGAAAGHVAIVEKINSDGSIETSNSGWNWTKNRYNSAVVMLKGTSPTWTPWSGYTFQGFIYNPACEGLSDKLSEFLKEAQSHVGEHGDWTWRVSGLGRGQPWCAAFVNAVGKTVGGIIGTIMPQSFGAGDYPRLGVHSPYNGQWLKGPAQGGNPTPQSGDLILFRWDDPSAYYGGDQYLSDHIGIVLKVSDSKVYTIEGNTGSYDNWASCVKQKEYSRTYSCINGYFRPDWARIGGNPGNLITADLGPLYTIDNTYKDALLREIAYVNGNKPSIQSSNIQLSAMNYTFLLNSLYKFGYPYIAQSGSSSSAVNVDGLENNAKSVVRFFLAQGLNAAAGVGVAANIFHESNFRTDAVGDDGTSFGICQWHLGRGEAMKKMAGPDWANDMTGQLQYLWYELTNSYKSTLSHLKSVSNNESGARSAADYFVRHFEVPANVDYQSQIRQDTASEMWMSVVPVLTSDPSSYINL